MHAKPAGQESDPTLIILSEQQKPWMKKRKVEVKVREIERYLTFSFRKDFKINGRNIELFEAPKVLGDVFESIMGAVYVDGGIEAIIQVYEYMLAPFVLYTAKYSKKLNKEPKEDFILLAGVLKIRPRFDNKEAR